VRRSVTFTLAWLIAAGVATGAAWQGVAIVTNQVTNDRPDSFSAAEVQGQLDAADADADAAAATTTTVDSTGSTDTTTNSSSTTTPTTTATTVAPINQTFNLVGGSTTLQFTPSGVTVLGSTPNLGFSVEQETEHGNGVKVEFESESHRSRVDGWWDGGPQFREREDPDSSGEG
jgi:hypothetical protein